MSVQAADTPSTHVRRVRVIACTPYESGVTPEAAAQALALPVMDQAAITYEVQHTTSITTAVAAAGKTFIGAATELPQGILTREEDASQSSFTVSYPLLEEYCCVFLGPQVARLLLIPSNSARASVEALLDGARRSAMKRRGLAVLLGVFAFARETLENPAQLSAPLARSAGWLSYQASASQQPPSNLATFLPAAGLQYGRERIQLPSQSFIEVRSIVEYDAVMDALFGSASFSKIQAACTLQLCVALATIPSRDEPPTLQALFSTWLMDARHVEEFTMTRTTNQPSIVEGCVRHLNLSTSDVRRCRAPQLTSVVVSAVRYDELVARSSILHRLLLGSASASGRLLPPEYRDTITGEDTVTMYRDAAAQADHRNSMQSDRREVEARRKFFEEAAVESQHASTESELRQQLRKAGETFDAADASFQKALRRLEEEKTVLAKYRDLLEQLHAKAESHEGPRKSLDEQRKTLVLQLQELRSEEERLKRAAASSQSEEARWQTERMSLIKSHEQERDAEIRRAAGEVQSVMDRQAEGEGRLKREMEDELRQMEATEISLKEQLRSDHQRAVTQWKEAESTLTSRMMEVTKRREELEATTRAVSQKREEAALLEHRLRTNANADGLMASSALGFHDQATAENEALRRELDVASARLVERQRRLEALKGEVIEAQTSFHRVTEECADLRTRRAEQRSIIESEAASRTSQTNRFFSSMELSRRKVIQCEESQRWRLIVSMEMEGWVEALHASEARLLDEAKMKCREEVFGVERRLKDLEAVRASASEQCESMLRRLEDTKEKHKVLRQEVEGNLTAARTEELSLLMFLQDAPDASSNAAAAQSSLFPALEEDERAIRAKIERVKQALTGGSVALHSETSSRRPVRATIAPFAAQLAASFRQTVGGLMRKLERLVAASLAATENQKTACQALAAALASSEAECQSRRELLERVIQQVAALEKKRFAVNAHTSAAHQDLAERRRRQEEVRRRLEDAYVAARATASQHLVEGQQHLRKLHAEEETLTREMQQLQEDTSRLEDAKSVLEEKQSAAATAAVELRIQREVQRHEELLQLIAHEQAVIDKYYHQRELSTTSSSLALPPHAAKRVVSPVPDLVAGETT